MKPSYLSLLSFVAVATAQDQPGIVDLLTNTPDLSSLLAAITSVEGLADTLGNATNITILAPNNDAFGALGTAPEGEALAATLQYHVLQGTYPSNELPEDPAFPMSLLNNTAYTNVTGGQRVWIERDGSNVSIRSGNLTDAANVVTADVAFNGGIVHVINKVLTVPTSASDTATRAGLSTLAGALGTANLVETVDGLSNVTIFAPSNDAFTAIGSAVNSLTPEALANILTYHVVVADQPVYSSDLEDDQRVPTVEGAEVTINIDDGNIFVNGARVITPDILIAGGVVHVIDNVLNPDNASAAPSGDATTGAPAFPDATSASVNPAPAPTEASTGAAQPMRTAAVGVAALFGGAAAVMMA